MSIEKDLKIDIVSDVICPWCYIGQERLKKALKQSGLNAEINWQPYQLHPDMPIEGADKFKFLEDKFGGSGEAMFKRVEEAAGSEGLAFNTENIANIPNTVESHRVMHLAKEKGIHNEMAHAFFKAYFSEGADLTSIEGILETAVKGGLEKAETLAYLESDVATSEVKSTEQQYKASGVSAVPTFIINNKYMIQGAQSPETFISAFQQLEIKSDDSLQ
jgi:predicted DsbA family dithiol-disulfide isomerase